MKDKSYLVIGVGNAPILSRTRKSFRTRRRGTAKLSAFPANRLSGSDLILLCLFIVVLLLYAVQLIMNNAFSTKGIPLDQMQQQNKELDRQNIILRQAVLIARSYRVIDEEARRQGFVDMNDNSYYTLR